LDCWRPRSAGLNARLVRLAKFAKLAIFPAMTTMNISLPDSLKKYVDQQVSSAGFGSASEYVRELIRLDQVRQAERELARLLAEGFASGPAVEASADYWAARRSRLAK
jgi:antitoxin ParD1/3/4